MKEDQRDTLSLKAAYSFGIARGLQREVDEIRSMEIEWDRSYTSSVRRGYIVALFEEHGILEEFKEQHWQHGNTRAGESKRRRYLRLRQEYEDFLAGRTPEAAATDSEEEDLDPEFAAETDLRDFLAEHPTVIEPGLRLHREGDKTGVEFPVKNGLIDMLAVDREGRFVVIELKVGRGRNKAVGQLLYYMGWVDTNLGRGPCRGMIIAKDIPEDLRLAVQRVPEVSLLRYHLSVSLEPILPNED